MRVRIVFSFIFCLLCVTLPIYTVQAQVTIDNRHIRLAVPEAIFPNTYITATLQAHTIEHATFYWFIDGVEVTAFRGYRSVQIYTGDVGEAFLLQVATAPSPSLTIAEKHIRPVAVDMIVESDSVTPVFYKGRALPHKASNVRLTAIIHTGDVENPRDYSYRWILNGKVYQGGTIVGKQSIDIILEHLRHNEVELEVFDRGGDLVAKRRYTIPTVDPELYFYISNPLRGLTQQAIGTEYFFLHDEVDVRAEPYFITSEVFEHPINRWGWSINDANVQITGNDPLNITLRKTAETGKATVSFYVRDVLTVDYTAENSFTVHFDK